MTKNCISHIFRGCQNAISERHPSQIGDPPWQNRRHIHWKCHKHLITIALCISADFLQIFRKILPERAFSDRLQSGDSQWIECILFFPSSSLLRA